MSKTDGMMKIDTWEYFDSRDECGGANSFN